MASEGMLGTPFQFGKPIQFDSSASLLTGWKRYTSEDRASKPSISSRKCWGSPVSIKPNAGPSNTTSHRPTASIHDTLSHGWLTYAPITIVPGATSKPGTGRSMSITLRERTRKAEPSLEHVLPATYQNAKAQEVAATNPGAVPGPGQYNVPSMLRTGPTYTMAKRTAKPETKADVPGVGTYDTAPELQNSGPAFTAATRPAAFSAADEDLPGPGAYYDGERDRRIGAEGPAFSIAGGTRPTVNSTDTSAAAVPGPGQYEECNAQKAAPAFSFVKAPRRTTEASKSDAPAPTAYNPPQPPPLGPAWSFPNTQRDLEASEEDQQPAPGDYTALVPKKSSAYTIPKAPRAITRKTPQAYSIGPGEYCTIATVPEGPAFTIPASGAHKPPTQDEDTPAPGEYEVPSMSTAPAYSIARRFQNLPEPSEVNPVGPAEYFVPAAFPAGPAFTVPQAPLVDTKTDDDTLPGPQDYNPTKPRPEAPAYSIPTADPASKPPQSPTPGPDTYASNPAPTKPAAPAFTIATRLPEPSTESHLHNGTNVTPAPGDFDARSMFPEGPAFTFPMENKNSGGDPYATSGDKYAPGVGDYEPHAFEVTEVSAPAFSFPRTLRAIAEEQKNIEGHGGAHIGPGEYELPAVGSGPAYTMGEAPKERIVPGQANADAADMPGPQDYETGCLAPAGPAWSMPKTHRSTADSQKDSRPAVGPGTYDSKDIDSGPAWTIQGKEAPASTEFNTSVTVGPGAYDTTSATAPQAPAYTIPAAPRGLGDSSEPSNQEYSGPAVGDYEVHVPASTPAFSIPKAGIHGANSEVPGANNAPQALGPGEYLGVGQAGEGGPAFTIPKADAMGGNYPGRGEALPGPGDYKADCAAVEKQAPAFTMGLRPIKEAECDQEPLPGPQDYTPPDPPKGPAFSIAPRLTDDPAAKPPAGPGVGEYHPPAPAKGPAFTIAARVGDSDSKLEAEQIPGPSDYQPKVVHKGPAYTIAGKLASGATTSDLAPGPGEYEPPTKSDGAAYTMGAKTAPPSAPAHTPGVGEYDISQSKRTGDGLAFTMAGKTGQSALDRIPENALGPGEYHTEKDAGGLAYSIPTGPRGNTSKTAHKEVTAGPGEYETQDEPRTTPAWTFAGKRGDQKGSIHPDPGQYEGMHADTSFPAHHRGTLFDAPPPDPPEPLLAPPTRSLANIVSTFLSSSDCQDAPTCKHSNSKVSAASPNKRGSYTMKDPQRSTSYRRGSTRAGSSGTSRKNRLEHGSMQTSRIPTKSSARVSRNALRASS